MHLDREVSRLRRAGSSSHSPKLRAESPPPDFRPEGGNAPVDPLLYIMSGIIGAGGAFLGGFAPAWLQQKNLRVSVALGIKGEVEAIHAVIQKREYLKDVKDARDKTERTREVHPFWFKASRDYFAIYRSNLNHIGLLGPMLARDTAQLYTYASAILEDIDDFDEYGRPHTDPDVATRRYNELIHLFEECDELSGTIINEIDKKFASHA